MASPISPGDVLAIIKTVWDLYKKYADAPEEMKKTARQLSTIEVSLKDYVKPSNHVPYFNTQDGKQLKHTYLAEFSLLNELLLELKEIGKVWRKERRNPFRKFWFSNFTIKHLPALREEVREKWNVIRSIRNDGLSANANKSAMARDKAYMDKIHQSDRKTRATIMASQNERKTGGKKVRNAAQQSADMIDETSNKTADLQFREAFQTLLKVSGVSEGDINGYLNNSGTVQHELTSYRISTSYFEILIVCDLADLSRALEAQAHLEFARIWIANTQNRWLFYRVATAVYTRTPAAKMAAPVQDKRGLSSYEAIKASGEALTAIACHMDDYSTTDWPKEEEPIICRLVNQSIQDLVYTNTKRYHYILSLTQERYKTMKELAAKDFFDEKAVIEHLCHKPDTNMANVNDMREATEAFLEETLSWTKPTKSFGKAQSRTCWVDCDEKSQRDAIIDDHFGGREALEQRTGCKVRRSWIGADRGYTIAITGPLEKVREAEKIIKAAKTKV